MFSKKLVVILATGLTVNAFAGYEEALKKYGRGNVSLAGYRDMIIELDDGGYQFALIPWVKDYLVKSRKRMDPRLEKAVDNIMTTVGVKTFESLPENILSKVNSPNIRYILAKRSFSKSDFATAEKLISKVDPNHSAYPFIKHLSGVILAHKGDYRGAATVFNECVKSSENKAKNLENSVQKDQMLQNRDYCLAGIARSFYGLKDYKRADLAYLDIQKESLIWPNILFEEAWNSYQLKNYNRTLGKLVTYRAPVLDFIFNPEVDVLKALSYLKMCLYDDARNTADDFYNEHSKEARNLRSFILRNKKNYKYYYDLMANYESGKESLVPYVNKALKSLMKDSAYQEIKSSLSSAVQEYKKIETLPSSNLKSQLLRNMRTVLDEYRSTLGAYVRSSMVSKYAELYRAFQDMSYIKLEVLAQRKERLYQNESQGRKRGDVKYIERNDKQYFWNFNGEFWADELGDYVFALRSEC